MAIEVEKREFLSKDITDHSIISYGVSVEEDQWPDIYFKISDGSDNLYFDISGGNRKELNESLGKVIKLQETLQEFIDLVRDNQTEIFKAYAAKS